MHRKQLFLLALALCFLGGVVWAHGGSFRGPNGAVPPGLREPSDPEPPPPPPSNPGPPIGPESGGGDELPPVTPPGGHDTDTPDGAPPPVPTPPRRGPARPAKTALSFASWRFWWAYNNDDILNLKRHIYASGPSSYSPIAHGAYDAENRRNAQRPTEREVTRAVIPALMRSVNRPTDHEDVQGGALIAVGKAGSAKHVSVFQEVAWNRYRNPRGKRIDFGYQATESAVLALGLLQDLDAPTKDVVSGILLDAVADDSLRTRERSWAAVCLGLQRDEAALPRLMELLGQRYSDENVPAAILAGIGLIGDDSVVPELEQMFKLGKGPTGKNLSGRVRSFAGYALGKIGDPKALPTVIQVLVSRRSGRETRRSAAIATGILGARSDEAGRQDAVQALQRYLRKSGGDVTGENFAIIALSQVGTERALNQLLDLAEDGKYSQRSYAALGLGTHVYYRSQEEIGMDAAMRKRIVRKLIDLSRKYKDSDTKAAFLLARGLVQDKTAVGELIPLVAKRSGDPVLRGFCCVSLGLIGDGSKQVKDALMLALSERKSPDLRRDAATGLGLLHDAEVVPYLLKALKGAKSFAVQGQLITAIGTIGDHKAIAPLIELLDDLSQPTQTRAMAAVGLGMIADLREMPPLGRLSKNYNYRASVNDLDELLYIM